MGWQTASARLDYQLDGEMPLTETNQTTSRVNLYGNGLVMSGGETLWGDGLGATRQTTNSSQSVQWSSGYTAFGQSLSPVGSTNSHYGWGAGSGYRSDGFGPTYAASVMKVGCRYYDPEFGCFLTRDTKLSQKPYAYCNGDPVNFSDPSGHDTQWWQKPWQIITHPVSTAWNNYQALSDEAKFGVKGVPALFGLAGVGVGLYYAGENMLTQNEGLANEQRMLNDFEQTHPDADMMPQWELYNYYRTGTLKADGAFASQAANQYLHLY